MFLCKTSKKISSKSLLLRPQSWCWRGRHLKKGDQMVDITAFWSHDWFEIKKLNIFLKYRLMLKYRLIRLILENFKFWKIQKIIKLWKNYSFVIFCPFLAYSLSVKNSIFNKKKTMMSRLYDTNFKIFCIPIG